MSDMEKILQTAKDALDEAVRQKKYTEEFARNVGPAVIEVLKPVLEQLAESQKLSKEELLEAVSQIKIDVPPTPEATVKVELPDLPQPMVNVTVPEIKIPEPKAPIVKVTAPKPEVIYKSDDTKLIEAIQSVEKAVSTQIQPFQKPELPTFKKPMPVILTDVNGKPYIAGTMGGDGGKHGTAIIRDAQGNAATVRALTNANALNVALVDSSGNQVSSFGGGTQYAEGAAASTFTGTMMMWQGSDEDAKVISSADPLPVSFQGTISATAGTEYNDNATPDQAGGTGQLVMVFDGGSVQSWAGTSAGIGSVGVTDAFGSTAVNSVFNADNRLRVSVETGGSGLTDSELRASGVPVHQVSGSIWSTYVTGAAASTYAEIMNPDGRVKVELPAGSSGLTDTELRASGVEVKQVSGFTDSVNVVGFTSSVATVPYNPDGVAYNGDNPQPVSIPASVEVRQVSGLIDSVYVTGAAASTYAEIMNPDGRVKVELPSGGSGLTDTELRASGVEVKQVSGFTDSVNVVGFTSSVAVVPTTDAGNTAMDEAYDALQVSIVRVADLVQSVNIVSGSSAGTQYNDGATPDQSGGTGTLAMLFDGSSAQSWSGTSFGIGQVVLSGFDGTVLAKSEDTPHTGGDEGIMALTVRQDSAGNLAGTEGDYQPFITDGNGRLHVNAQISSVTPVLTVQQLSGAMDSVIVMGVADSMMVHQARTTNPTAKSDGADVRPSADDLGRTITRPIQMRDLTVTAYATLSNGTETTLLAASAGNYHDLIYVMGANTSDAAITVDIRAVTGGNIMTTLQIPASSTAGMALPVPIPQSETGNNWTADMGDYTNTTVYLTGLFSREV